MKMARKVVEKFSIFEKEMESWIPKLPQDIRCRFDSQKNRGFLKENKAKEVVLVQQWMKR
jgi:hypothetical protein